MSRRRLSDEERTLWTGVTRSIEPLRRRRHAAPADPPEPAASPPPEPSARPKSKPASVTSPPPAAARPPAPPALVPLGRRMRKQLARGSQPIDGRLDLHGLTQAEAHHALLGFLRSARARDARIVLVITGKGTPDPYAERGVLKRQVPLWLRLPEFRDFIVGFENAGAGHGRDGALYIRLRRARGEG